MKSSKPVIKQILNGYVFDWVEGDEVMVKVNITHLIQQSNKGLTAEIDVWASFMDELPILSGIRFNLNSERGRSGIAKRLESLKPKLPWGEILEQVCGAVIELFRKGEPVKELWTYEDVEQPKYLIYPIFPERQPTVIFGEPGVGKSELALTLGMVLILPWHDNPLGLKVQSRSIKSLVLDYETDDNEAKWRLKCLQRGMGLPELYLPYRRCYLPIADDIEQIQRHISESQAEVIIIDSLVAATGGDPNEANIAASFFNALRGLKVSSLIIGQTSKGEQKVKTILGSNIFTYYSRSIWECRTAEEPEEDIINIGLYHLKANMSRKHKPLGFQFEFNGDKTFVRRQDISDIPQLAERQSISVRIADELKQGAKSAKELTEILEVPRNTIDQTLKRMRDKGRAIRTGEAWGLVYQDTII